MNERPVVLAMHWPRFGPYHVARMNATFRELQPEGVRTVGLEVASQDATYEWQGEYGPLEFERRVVFAGQSRDAVSVTEMWAALWKALRAIDPSAVAINGYNSVDAWAALAWCSSHHCPAILMSESKFDDAPRVAWREWSKRRVIRRFACALCGGSPQRAYLEQLGMSPEQIFVGYDVVDNDFFQQETVSARQNPAAYRHLPGLETCEPFFLASARFIPRKNLPGLLVAYHQYRVQSQRDHRDLWRLVILGDGDERVVLESLIRDLPIEGVTLPGFHQLPDLPAYYGLARAFIHPALQEPWGLVVNEAMASGLPVLVSERCGCVPDLVRPGVNGFVFDPQDIRALTNLMIQCTSGCVDLTAMGKAAQDHVRRWGPERFAQGMSDALHVALWG